MIDSGKLNLFAGKIFLDSVVTTLSGTGQVNLSNSAGNLIVGLAVGMTLDNAVRIDGAGDIGDGVMVLINQASGQIIGNQTLALTLDTGTATITNAGLIENVGKGGTTIVSAVNNTGVLEAATTGTLEVQGAITGSGIGVIHGGALFVEQAYAEKVVFTGSTGVLELGDSQAFTGQVAGLSAAGTNSLDLTDIVFHQGCDHGQLQRHHQVRRAHRHRWDPHRQDHPDRRLYRLEVHRFFRQQRRDHGGRSEGVRGPLGGADPGHGQLPGRARAEPRGNRAPSIAQAAAAPRPRLRRRAAGQAPSAGPGWDRPRAVSAGEFDHNVRVRRFGRLRAPGNTRPRCGGWAVPSFERRDQSH